MPRGVRKPQKPFEDQIAEIDLKISTHQTKISELTAKKKAVISQKEKSELDALYQYVKDSGKTPAELIADFKKE